jgi:hypothetical protein
MARLYVDGEWYDALSSHSLYESEYERVILSRAEALLPDWHLVKFKRNVESEDGRKAPDFALLDREYRSWWVVEVELSHHDLNSHVVPQVRVLRAGRYGADHVEYLLRQRPDLDPDRCRDMILGRQPRVWVVADQGKPEWLRALHALDALLGVVEIFRSVQNRHILRLNGEQPPTQASEGTRCRRDPSIRRLWEVESPALLRVATGQQLDISVDGRQTTWRRVDTGSKAYLAPVHGDPLGLALEVELVRTGSEGLTFRIVR